MRDDRSIASAIERARKTLDQAGIADAQLSAEILLAHTLNLSRTSLRTWPERALDPDALRTFDAWVARRASGEPIAYLTGTREFWSLDLHVTPATLIPRAETERLVERALACLPVNAECRVADLGTGTGAIALAIARERPRCHVVAIDVSGDAVTVARENTARLGCANVEIRLGDWYGAIAREQFDVIVSNPPYIAVDDPHLGRGDLRFEPRCALTCGADALRDLRLIIGDAPTHLVEGGVLLVEHGYDQRDAVCELFRATGFRDIEVFDDYAGLPRGVSGRRA